MGLAMIDSALGPVGFGGAPIGLYPDDVSDAQASAILDAAWAHGIRHYDTAAFYGAGRSERRLRPFVAAHLDDGIIVSTKVGRSVVGSSTEFDFSADGIARQFDEALERLGVERVDIVFLHDPDDHWEHAIARSWPVLRELRASGRASAIGIGMNDARMLRRFVHEADPDVILLANRYTLLDQDPAVDLLQDCLDRDVAVIAGGVFNTGVLATGVVPGAQYDYQDAPEAILNDVARWQRLCDDHGVPLGAAATQFPLTHPAVVSVLLGIRTMRELDTDLAWARTLIPSSLWAKAREMGLLRPGTPIPHH